MPAEAGAPTMTARAADIEALRSAHDRVLERMATAAARVDRDPSDLALVAVSKTVEVERLRAAVAAGIDRLGENRVQEAEAKRPALSGAGPGEVAWELVGPLQSNKARRALATFDRIQSVDSVALAERLDRLVPDVRPGARYPILVQVNVDADPAKSGLLPATARDVLSAVLDLPNLEVQGLMTVGHLVRSPVEARSTFRALRSLSERLRAVGLALGPELSMGMTDDFEVAIEEGATIVRVGRAIFGERPHDHGDGAGVHTHRG